MNTFFWTVPRRMLVVACLGLLLTGCQKNDDTVAVPKTITDRILEDSQFSLLRVAINHAGVSDALKGANLTLFAPNDAAFQASGLGSEAAVRALPKEQLKNTVLYHLLSSPVAVAKIPSGSTPVQTVGGVAFINNTSGVTYVNNGRLTQTDISTANGYIHVIDRVLTTSSASLLTAIQNNPDLTFLTAAIKRIGTANPTLLTTLDNTTSANPVTLFAPNDAAFKADSRYNTLAAIQSADPQTLANTLLYHVVSGVIFSNQLQTGNITTLLNGNRLAVTVSANLISIRGNKNTTAGVIRTPDLVTNNGVIQVIDQILQP